MNTQYYRDNILANMLPEIDAISGDNYIFMQDGVRPHTAQATIEYLHENCTCLLEADYSPPNSPDLHPLDYCLWDLLESKIWRENIESMEVLTIEIEREWDAIPQQVGDKAIDLFRKRVKMVIDAVEGQIERYL